MEATSKCREQNRHIMNLLTPPDQTSRRQLHDTAFTYRQAESFVLDSRRWMECQLENFILFGRDFHKVHLRGGVAPHQYWADPILQELYATTQEVELTYEMMNDELKFGMDESEANFQGYIEDTLEKMERTVSSQAKLVHLAFDYVLLVHQNRSDQLQQCKEDAYCRIENYDRLVETMEQPYLTSMSERKFLKHSDNPCFLFCQSQLREANLLIRAWLKKYRAVQGRQPRLPGSSPYPSLTRDSFDLKGDLMSWIANPWVRDSPDVAFGNGVHQSEIHRLVISRGAIRYIKHRAAGPTDASAGLVLAAFQHCRLNTGLGLILALTCLAHTFVSAGESYHYTPFTSWLPYSWENERMLSSPWASSTLLPLAVANVLVPTIAVYLSVASLYDGIPRKRLLALGLLAMVPLILSCTFLIMAHLDAPISIGNSLPRSLVGLLAVSLQTAPLVPIFMVILTEALRGFWHKLYATDEDRPIFANPTNNIYALWDAFDTAKWSRILQLALITMIFYLPRTDFGILLSVCTSAYLPWAFTVFTKPPLRQRRQRPWIVLLFIAILGGAHILGPLGGVMQGRETYISGGFCAPSELFMQNYEKSRRYLQLPPQLD